MEHHPGPRDPRGPRGPHDHDAPHDDRDHHDHDHDDPSDHHGLHEPGVPIGAPEPAVDPDDLSLVRSPMQRFVERTRGWLAVGLALALVIPAGGWAIDEFVFGRSGDAVEAELGDDAWLAEAVLLVRSTDCAGQVSTGSAFAIDLDGSPTLVTNRHVVASARSVGVRPLDGGPALTVAAHRVAADADVAVLELADPDDLPEPLALGPPADRGDEVRTIGFPGGRPATRTGTVADLDAARLWLAVGVAPGASGSPVLDTDGRVVGQVFARSADGEGLATNRDALVAAARGAAPAPDC